MEKVTGLGSERLRLRQVEERFNQLIQELQVVRYAAPPKPREGTFVFADGTTWNPGSGRGLYQYVSNNPLLFHDRLSLRVSSSTRTVLNSPAGTRTRSSRTARTVAVI